MSNDDLPPSPLSALAAAVTEMHEIYTAMVGAGFTREQAMQMLCAMLAAMVSGQSS